MVRDKVFWRKKVDGYYKLEMILGNNVKSIISGKNMAETQRLPRTAQTEHTGKKGNCQKRI